MAVYVVGAVVALEGVLFLSVFWFRAMVVPVNFQAPVAAKTPTHVATAMTPAPALPSLLDTGRLSMPDLPALTTVSPHTALLSLPAVSDKLEQVSGLNEQAQGMRRGNNLRSALDVLLQAEDIDARNPTTLKNLAETTYLLNSPVLSKIYWQRLVDLGPNVGTIYGVARDHVLLLSTHEADALELPSYLPRAVYIDQVEKTPVATANGEPQFHVRTVLMRRNAKMPNFEQKKLRPFVIFYQQLSDGSLTPDLAKRSGSFDDTFLFWNGKLKEAFGVDYILPVPGTPGPNNTTNGNYYGFVIGIYYDNVLQDARSEPSDLIKRQPLPNEIE